MASLRKSGVNRPQKASFINGTPANDIKFKSRPGVIVPNRVFVGGICPSATENDLLGLFAKYGAVKAVKIISDQNGSSKGYGFVTYEKPDDVTRLQNDAKNLIFNDRRLNIAPAVMKNPPFVNRYPDSYVVPVTPSNIYFANNIPYQYQEGNTVFPNGPYPPPLTVLPAVSDAAYYQNGYSSSPNFIPTTPYQGAALFYPVPHNTSPVMVGPQPYNSSYQPASVSNSNYIYSSPAPVTSSPPTTSAKASTAVTNTSDVHATHATQMIATAPPNVSSVPPPLPYPLAHPPQYYNSTVAPPYSGEVYYNIQGACYPVMTVGGHDAYIPYYDVTDNCNNSVPAEENNYEPQNYHATPTNTPVATMNVQNYADVNGKEPPVAMAANNDAKQMVPMNASAPAPEHAPESYTSEPNHAKGTPQTPAHVQQHAVANTEYNGHSNYIQHRGAIIYPNTPIPPGNIYFNSVYMAETTTPGIAQTPYPKNLSEHYVSDHLPKRDSKYTQPKKYPSSPQTKDNSNQIPNIPKFPFYVNNNYPGYVNRNVKEKEYNKNGVTGAKVIENKQPQRPPRSNSNGSGGPKPRVFHNQNQFANGPRPQRNNNAALQQGNANLTYPRSSSVGPARSSYDQNVQHNVRAYEYQNNYQKNNAYENKKQNQANGGYRVKYDKVNGQSNNDAFAKNAPCEERVVAKKYTQNDDAASVTNNNTANAVAPTINASTVNENNNSECVSPEQQDKGDDGVSSANVQVQQQQQQPQQICNEMQKLTL